MMPVCVACSSEVTMDDMWGFCVEICLGFAALIELQGVGSVVQGIQAWVLKAALTHIGTCHSFHQPIYRVPVYRKYIASKRSPTTNIQFVAVFLALYLLQTRLLSVLPQLISTTPWSLPCLSWTIFGEPSRLTGSAYSQTVLHHSWQLYRPIPRKRRPLLPVNSGIIVTNSSRLPLVYCYHRGVDEICCRWHCRWIKLAHSAGSSLNRWGLECLGGYRP